MGGENRFPLSSTLWLVIIINAYELHTTVEWMPPGSCFRLRRTVPETYVPIITRRLLCCGYILKNFRVEKWVTWGHMFLCLSPGLAQLGQDEHKSVRIKLRAFCMKISLWLILYFWEKCRWPCSGFLLGIFSGGQNLLLCKFLLLCYCFRTKFQVGANCLRGCPLAPCGRKPAVLS